jgi:hypothetical protein
MISMLLSEPVEVIPFVVFMLELDVAILIVFNAGTAVPKSVTNDVGTVGGGGATVLEMKN